MELSEKLREKEQEVQMTNTERDKVQKHLQNLERLILRSVKPTVSRLAQELPIFTLALNQRQI